MNEPATIRRLLTDTTTWAVVGCSADPARDSHGVAAFLQRNGIAMDDISVTTPTLDDVFLNLTGHSAEPETEEAEVRSR